MSFALFILDGQVVDCKIVVFTSAVLVFVVFTSAVLVFKI